ncbi:erlin (er lipid raft associated protein) [Anaeramoeba flamelloides]|uniref:Erlin (Er lipid raft associated protein) n=1 Tax=Anaeramoeba flamelloides TaxID=1746091 RepID=A0ABQ8Y147_9EUKA|nr:erlin (er lipid raft associated protein) [Anaeramoeba flamelloides]
MLKLSVIISIAFCLCIIVVIIPLIAYGGHHIPEGSIGVYYVGGKLTDKITQSGYHIEIPFISKHKVIQTTLKTSKIKNVECGTSSGIMLNFNLVEVNTRLKHHLILDLVRNYSDSYLNLWIKQRVHHEMNELCSKKSVDEIFIHEFDKIDNRLKGSMQKTIDKYSPAIQIISVRVSKPSLPKNLLQGYTDIEKQKSYIKLANQKQPLELQKAETEKIRALENANKEFQVRQIEMKSKIEKIKSKREISKLEDQLLYARKKGIADGVSYKKKSEASINSKLLTKQYLKLQVLNSMTQNNRINYGSTVQNVKKIEIERSTRSK